MPKFNELNQIADEYNIGKGGKDGWLTLEAGDNKIRLVSFYDVLAKHFIGKGQKPVTCIGDKEGCLHCKMAKEWEEEHKNDAKKLQNPNRPTVKFLFWCIDRKDGKMKIAEVGWTVIKAISDLQEDEEYGYAELPDYDINIKKVIEGNGSQPSDTKYSVIPSRVSKPLTPEEEAEIAKLTPIEDVIKNLKKKVQKEYEDMGMGGEDDEVPPPDEPDLP